MTKKPAAQSELAKTESAASLATTAAAVTQQFKAESIDSLLESVVDIVEQFRKRQQKWFAERINMLDDQPGAKIANTLRKMAEDAEAKRKLLKTAENAADAAKLNKDLQLSARQSDSRSPPRRS